MKKKETLGKYEKGIIIGGIAVLIIFLILLTADGIKNIGKNNNNLALSEQEEKITNTPNAPVLSAGMIPVKYNGDNLVICKNDSTWYNYNEGTPAYMMLNDGVYQSELTVDMTGKKLANEYIGQTVLEEELGTIYMWIPRFAQKENGEIGYIKEETELGGEWKVPETFTYIVEDETKPNFSLSGIWIEKEPLANIDAVNTKITNMNKENNIYGFIANTVGIAMTEKDRTVVENFSGRALLAPTEQENQDNTVGAQAMHNEAVTRNARTATINCARIDDPSNSNRTILKIINTNKQEPIKANIKQNTVANTIEIRVTYTKNGIREIVDENGNKLMLREEKGVILADTGERVLGKGTYTFTVVDNKGNKQNLNITINVNSIYKVAYINGTDNMDNTATYTKAQEAKSDAETDLINQLSTLDTTKNFSKAIKDSNGLTTAITQKTRTETDEVWDVVGLYNVKGSYSVSESKYRSYSYSDTESGYKRYCCYGSYSVVDEFAVEFSNPKVLSSKGQTGYFPTDYMQSSGQTTAVRSVSNSTFYKFVCTERSDVKWTSSGRQDGYFKYDIYKVFIIKTGENKGSFRNNIMAKRDSYIDNAINGEYWYEKGDIAPKYTLYKYDKNLTLQSTYDVDTKILTTAPIDISNRGNNKVKLTLSASGTDYKTYISNDNSNWQELTDITSGEPKELNVDGFNNLYIKIETNTSTINNIDVALFKD